ncbi:translation initiation factor eIF-2B subunit gamma-like [Gossypium hirsutum]|uniref:Translation initiation factor eIF2B subunit gamma n=1 Tax=Gossypium hirsutum TaxID=3635 RepID=A0A1U8J0Y2_GOSHI|nr:translation initiation factor eIF-2B subunit gamma-like [Gossypium hirsutum]
MEAVIFLLWHFNSRGCLRCFCNQYCSVSEFVIIIILKLPNQIAVVPEDIGTAGALRAISHYLTTKDILVVSGDLVSDVSLGAIAATHRRHDAVVTATLCSVPISRSSELGSSGGKDKTKKPGRYNIIGLDPCKQFLLHIAIG